MAVLTDAGARPAGQAAGTQAFLVAVYLQRTLDRSSRRARPVLENTRVISPDLAPDALPTTQPPGSASPQPASLERATRFIEGYAADPIGLAEIAGAARLSPRALQVAFRRHLDTTPLAHLRSVRLARAHADLQAAQPGRGQTVSTIASSWGFGQLSRFARDYRRCYGVAPHQTLDSDQ